MKPPLASSCRIGTMAFVGIVNLTLTGAGLGNLRLPASLPAPVLCRCASIQRNIIARTTVASAQVDDAVRTTADVRRTDGQSVCFGTLPPYKPGIPKGTVDGLYGDLRVKFRWDRLGTDTAAGIMFSEEDADTVRGSPGFEAV